MPSTRSVVSLLLALSLSALTSISAQQDTSKKTAPNTELPILPTRQAAFTTDEGTWMSLDVSPDGKTIVFDLVGDLYSVPIAGGKATRLTSGMGFDGQPRYSPDGTTILFVSDRSGYENLWLIDADGKDPRALTKDKDAQYISPAWTTDGAKLAYVQKTGRKKYALVWVPVGRS